METTRVEPINVIEGRAIGELQGTGRWQLSHDGALTTARYDWKVQTTKAWMNLVAPIARPLFSWNHDVVMARPFFGSDYFLQQVLISFVGKGQLLELPLVLIFQFEPVVL